MIYIPQLVQPEGEIKLGFESIWEMPTNASELESAVYWAAGKILPLTVTAPEWVGVSHDTQEKREVIHLFNYNSEKNVGGIILEYSGIVKKAWNVSPDEEVKSAVPFIEEKGMTTLRIPNLKVYKVIVLER